MCFRPASVGSNETIVCQNCGTENPKGNILCMKCAKKAHRSRTWCTERWRRLLVPPRLLVLLVPPRLLVPRQPPKPLVRRNSIFLNHPNQKSQSDSRMESGLAFLLKDASKCPEQIYRGTTMQS